jgi:hypothetical protein
MILRSVLARSICPPFITGFQTTPGQSSATIRLPAMQKPFALSSVANLVEVISGTELVAPVIENDGNF